MEKLLKAIKNSNKEEVETLGFETEWSNPNVVGTVRETLEWVLDEEEDRIEKCPSCGEEMFSYEAWCHHCGFTKGKINILPNSTVRILQSWTYHDMDGNLHEVAGIEINGKVYHYGCGGLKTYP